MGKGAGLIEIGPDGLERSLKAIWLKDRIGNDQRHQGGGVLVHRRKELLCEEFSIPEGGISLVGLCSIISSKRGQRILPDGWISEFDILFGLYRHLRYCLAR